MRYAVRCSMVRRLGGEVGSGVVGKGDRGGGG